MDTLIAILGSPAVLVLLGAAISRTAARRLYVEQQSMTELIHRRKIYADYQRALWAYAGQVRSAMDALHKPQSGLSIDVAEVNQRQEASRNVLADLQTFAEPATYATGRDAHEHLSWAFNAAAAGDLDEAEKHFDGYEGDFKQFAAAVNEDVSSVNTILYTHATPLWRAVFRRLRRRPLPFEPTPTLTPLHTRSKPH